MATTRIRVGVVGCRGIASRSYLPVLTKHDRCAVTAVCDVVPERARAATADFGIPAHYGDYDRFLREAEVEAVVVLRSRSSARSTTGTSWRSWRPLHKSVDR